MFHSFLPRLRLFLFPLLSKLFCFLFIIRPPHDNVSSSSSDLFVYSSEKAVKEGTLHVDHIKVYSPKKRQSNFILLFRKVPSHNYYNQVISCGQTSQFSQSLRAVTMKQVYFCGVRMFMAAQTRHVCWKKNLCSVRSFYSHSYQRQT